MGAPHQRETHTTIVTLSLTCHSCSSGPVVALHLRKTTGLRSIEWHGMITDSNC